MFIIFFSLFLFSKRAFAQWKSTGLTSIDFCCAGGFLVFCNTIGFSMILFVILNFGIHLSGRSGGSFQFTEVAGAKQLFAVRCQIWRG